MRVSGQLYEGKKQSERRVDLSDILSPGGVIGWLKYRFFCYSAVVHLTVFKVFNLFKLLKKVLSYRLSCFFFEIYR